MNTEKSFRIVENDLDRSVFVKFPYEHQIIKENTTEWLEGIKTALEAGAYVAGDCQIAEVPKGKGAIRPGSVLTIADMTAYTALVDRAHEKIFNEIKWAQGKKDFAYNLVDPAEQEGWFNKSFIGWENFRKKSLDLLKRDTSYVVIADITGFYENIDHSLLCSDLRQLEVDEPVIKTIRELLVAWSQIPTKGIPQGVSASHLLAKLYLDSVDKELSDLGYRHIRYNDDFRIFCANYSDAKKALMILAALLRRRGLNLQSAKSRIVRADVVKPEFEGAATIIQGIVSELRELSPYPFEDDDTTPGPNEEQLSAVKEAFSNYFTFGDEDKFNKSLFHYLLHQLSKAADDFAVDYCLTQIEKHPEETAEILKYFSNTPSKRAEQDVGLTYFILLEPSVYDYQNFQILEWFYSVGIHDNAILDYCRGLAFDNNTPIYLKATCKKMLGAFGTATDLNRIKRSYSSAVSSIEECAIICSLRRLERSARNVFIASKSDKSDYHRIAGIIAKRV